MFIISGPIIMRQAPEADNGLKIKASKDCCLYFTRVSLEIFVKIMEAVEVTEHQGIV